MNREEIMAMDGQKLCDWLETKNVLNKYISPPETSYIENLEHLWNFPACAFAARDFCVNNDLAIEWHDKLEEVPELPWLYSPTNWLRAAAMVIAEKENEK